MRLNTDINKRLVYREDYKDTSGLDFLRDAKIEIVKYG